MVVSTKLYDILGVDPKADTVTIKKAYRKKAMKYHPDRHSSAESADKKKAEDKFKDISNAYDVLCDEKKRQVYDQLGDEGLQRAAADAGMSDGGMPDIISELLRRGGFPFNMGGMGRRPQQSKSDTMAEISISLMDAYLGCTKTVPRRWQRKCPSCDGCGAARKEDVVECTNCNGRGVRVEIIRHPMGMLQQQTSCHPCKGKGKTIASGSECESCDGKRIIYENKQYDIKLPAGVQDGNTCEFEGEGEWDPQWTNDKPLGNMIFIIRIQYDTNVCPYKLEGGYHLVLRKSISLRDALCGIDFGIETLDKRLIRVYTDKMLQSGDCLVVENEGMPILAGKNSGKRGNLHIYIEVVYPTDRTVNKIVDKDKLEKTMSLLFRENPTTKQLDGRFHDIIGIPTDTLNKNATHNHNPTPIETPSVSLRPKQDGPPPMDDDNSSPGNRSRSSRDNDEGVTMEGGPQCAHQ